MNQSVKSVIALFIVITFITSFIGWLNLPDDKDVKFWLKVSTLPCIAFIGLLVWADFRRDKVPDFLRKTVGGYFERDGLCFAILVPHSGTCTDRAR